MEFPAIHQLQTPFEGAGIALLPGAAVAAVQLNRRARRSEVGFSVLQVEVLQPQLLGQFTGFGGVAHHAVQSQPAPSSMAAELPAGQHSLHRWAAVGVVIALTGLIKKLKRQQYPWSGEGWRIGLGIGEPTQA